MSDSLHPTEGIRLLLDRQSVSEDKESATYRAAIYTVDRCFPYRAELSMDGSAILSAIETAASEPDLDKLDKLARSSARAARRKRDEALPPWPQRILRWRGPGRG